MKPLRIIAALLVLAVPLTHAAEGGATETDKINYLISAVETLEGAKFIRNGAEYDPKPAADHLRLKLKRAGSKVKTADDFIRYCASSSSVSGKPYQIRFPDGRVTTAEAYLRERLAKFAVREENTSPAGGHDG